MSVKRVLAAAGLLLLALYIRVFMPTVSAELVPAVRQMLRVGQVEIALPETVAAWLSWD